MHPNLMTVSQEKKHNTVVDRVTLTGEGVHYAYSGLFVVFKGPDETVQLGILGCGVKGLSSFR